MALADLLNKKLGIYERMKEINDGPIKESRAMSAEELLNWDKAYADMAALDKEVKETRATEFRSKTLDELKAEMAKIEDRAARPAVPAIATATTAPLLAHQTPEYRALFTRYLSGDAEKRDLQMDVPTKGGFLVTPEQMVMDILKTVDDLVFVRQWATKFRVPTAASLGVPTLESDVDDAEWTGELSTGSLTSGPTFGKRELYPHPLAKQALCSMKLLRTAALDIEQWLIGRIAYKFGITQEKHFLLGNGVNQPLGLFVNSTDGIPAARDVLTGSSTGYTFNGLISARYSLKVQYYPLARWLFPRNGIEAIAKLTDLEGRYLWEPSRQIDSPDMLLGRPVTSSEYVPNIFTASKYVGMFADFSKYWIADALDMTVMRLNEIGALTNQVYYIARMECDGQPVLSEAFSRLVTNP